MAQQEDRRGGTWNGVQDSEVQGNLTQARSIFHVYFGRRWRKVEIAAGVVLLVLCVVGVGWVVGKAGGADRQSPGQSEKPVRKKTTINSSVNTSAWGCGESAVVPDLKVGPAGMAVPTRFPEHGIQAGESTISVVLQGSTDEEIILTGARAEIVARRAPSPGTHVINPCGSDVTARVFSVDLDTDNAPLKAIPDDRAEPGQKPFKGWPYAVKRSDAEQFVIRPRVTKQDTEFRVIISWSSGARQDELTLDDNGKPFRFASTTAADALCITTPRSGTAQYWLMPQDSPMCPEDR
jgi:hypothetical protein